MTIDLTWKDLKLIALHGSVEKDGHTVRIQRPILSTLTIGGPGAFGSVSFDLDISDERAKAAYEEPMPPEKK